MATVYPAWDTKRPATSVEKRKGYFQIPAFADTGLENEALSELVRQYNYTAGKNFTIRTLPAVPANNDFCLCVKYRVGETVTRYKLWENVGENLPHVELYSGQVIKSNFVFEIWKNPGETTVTLSSVMQVLSGVQLDPVDPRTLSNYALDDNLGVVPRSGLVLQKDTALPAGLSWHINPQDATTMVLSGSLLTSITEDVGQADDLIKFIGSDAVVGTQPTARSKTTIDFNAGQYQMLTPLVHPVTALRDFYVVFEPKAHNNGAVMITNIGIFKLIQGTSPGEYDFTNGFVNFTINGISVDNIYLLHLRWETTGGNDIVTATPFRLNSTGPVWEAGLVATDTQVAGGMTAAASPTFNGNTSRFKLLEFVAYDTIVDENEVYTYFQDRYSEDAFVFGSDNAIDFGTGDVDWLDNS